VLYMYIQRRGVPSNSDNNNDNNCSNRSSVKMCDYGDQERWKLYIDTDERVFASDNTNCI